MLELLELRAEITSISPIFGGKVVICPNLTHVSPLARWDTTSRNGMIEHPNLGSGTNKQDMVDFEDN